MNQPDPPKGTSDTRPGAMGGTTNAETSAQAASAKAAAVADDVKRRADDALATGIDRGAENLKAVTGAVEDVSKRIRNETPDSVAASLSEYCVDAVRRASTFAEGLRGRSIDDLASDLKGIARNNPAAFVAGSLAVGFALSRFLRASSGPRSNDSSRALDNPDQYGGPL